MRVKRQVVVVAEGVKLHDQSQAPDRHACLQAAVKVQEVGQDGLLVVVLGGLVVVEVVLKRVLGHPG